VKGWRFIPIGDGSSMGALISPDYRATVAWFLTPAQAKFEREMQRKCGQ
jgi:hypothetical protein